ncbi:MAG: EI24 domain-containing protein, partial [Herbaspirillum sp.]
PFVLSALVWGLGLWLGLQPMIDWLQAWFVNHEGFSLAGRVLGWVGLASVKAVIVPLIVMWLLLPLMVLTALIFIAFLALPVIVNHVSLRYYPSLEQRHGGNFFGSLWVFVSTLFIFVLLWCVTLPLALIPPVLLVLHPILWGWLTYRVMAYDALAAHASAEERHTILQQHRGRLLLIGVLAGAMGAAPTLLWLSGALTVILFPLLAAGAIWLYVLIFVFTGLWFQHYCLAALVQYRTAHSSAQVLLHPGQEQERVFKDIN